MAFTSETVNVIGDGVGGGGWGGYPDPYLQLTTYHHNFIYFPCTGKRVNLRVFQCLPYYSSW